MPKFIFKKNNSKLRCEQKIWFWTEILAGSETIFLSACRQRVTVHTCKLYPVAFNSYLEMVISAVFLLKIENLYKVSNWQREILEFRHSQDKAELGSQVVGCIEPPIFGKMICKYEWNALLLYNS